MQHIQPFINVTICTAHAREGKGSMEDLIDHPLSFFNRVAMYSNKTVKSIKGWMCCTKSTLLYCTMILHG